MGNLCNSCSKPGKAEKKKADEAYQRFKQSSNLHDLEAAIVHYREAAEARRPLLNDKYAVTSVTLGIAIWEHYELKGKPRKELDEVIHWFTEALNIWQKDNTNDYPILLVNLGNAYRDLFDKNENETEAEDAFRRSMQNYESARAFKTSHPDKYAEATMMLGTMLWTRCERQGHDTRLKDAINYLTEARQLLDGQPPVAICAYNLAGAYLTLAGKSGLPLEKLDSAIDSSIENYQAAVDLYPRDDPNYGPALYNLSQAFMRRYNSKHQASDLKSAKKHAASAKRAVSIDLQPRLDEILTFVKSEEEELKRNPDARLKVPNAPGGKPKKRSKVNLQATIPGPENLHAAASMGQTSSYANTPSDNGSRTQPEDSTSVGQLLPTTLYSRDPNSSNVTRNSSQGTSYRHSTDNLRTIDDAAPSGIPSLNITPAPNGRDHQHSNGLYAASQNTSKQKSRDDPQTSTQALSNHPRLGSDGQKQNTTAGQQSSTMAYPSPYSTGSNDVHGSSQGTTRHKSKDQHRTTHVVPAEAPPDDYTDYAAIITEKEDRNPISAQQNTSAGLYSRNTNGSTIGHQPSQDSSRRTSKDNLRNPTQPGGGTSLPPSSWSEKIAPVQQTGGQLASRQNSRGSLHTPNQSQSLAPSASVSSRNERDGQTQGHNGISNRSNDTYGLSSKMSKSGSTDALNHVAAPINYPLAPSDPADNWNGGVGQPLGQKVVAVEQSSASTSNNRGASQRHKSIDSLRLTTRVPGGYPDSLVNGDTWAETDTRKNAAHHDGTNHFSNQLEKPRSREPQKVNDVQSVGQRSSGRKSKDNLSGVPQPGSDYYPRYQ